MLGRHFFKPLIRADKRPVQPLPEQIPAGPPGVCSLPVHRQTGLAISCLITFTFELLSYLSIRIHEHHSHSSFVVFGPWRVYCSS